MNPEIVLGPPGTGKTTTLLNEVDHELAAGVAPDRIGFVTFTRRGAEEAIERACSQFSLSKDQLPWFRTLHSLCFRRLGMSRGGVFEGKRLREFAEFAGIRVTGRWSEDGTLVGFEVGDRILFMENLARVRCRPLREVYDQADDGLPWNLVNRVAQDLRAYKDQRGLLDFTDMLSEFVRSQVPLGLEVLVVDEMQDLSTLQWQVVDVLARGCRRVILGGDDDQCIYRWAGADAEKMIKMEGDVRVLGQSWRVPRAIQLPALRIAAGIRERREKPWAARERDKGRVDRAADIDDVPLEEAWRDGDPVQPILVLARNSYVLDKQVAPSLRQQGIVYERNGHPSIKRSTLSAILDWERLRRGERITAAEARVIYESMSVGVGVARGMKRLPQFPDELEVDIAKLERDGGLLRQDPWHDALDRLPQDDVRYIQHALQRGEDLRGRPRVRLSTIHGSKGGEAHHVVLLKEMARRSHDEMRTWPDDERRVWYVGVTRARDRLTVVNSSTNLECPWL